MARPTDDEIADQENEARAAESEGSRWPGMTYEQGVANALSWAVGHDDIKPMEEG